MKIVYILPGTSVSGGVKVAVEHIYLLNKIPGVEAKLISSGDYPKWTNIKIPFLQGKAEEMDLNEYDVIVTTFFNQISIVENYKNKILHLCQGFEGDYINDLNLAHLKNEIDKFYLSIKYVISINHYIKKRLLNFYPHLNIKVIGQGINKRIFRDLGLKRKYILVLGHFNQPFKGVEISIDIALEIKRLFPFLKIARINPVNKELEERSLYKFDEYFYSLTPREMAILYNQSALAIYLPTKEGFGLPIIESMACGTPLIISNIDPFKEITEERWPLFEPYKERKEIIKFTCSLINYKFLLKRYKHISKQILKKYSYYRLLTNLFITISTKNTN